MKRRDLIKLLESDGWLFKRHGGNHDIYQKDGYKDEPIPRSREINEITAEQILKRAGLK